MDTRSLKPHHHTHILVQKTSLYHTGILVSAPTSDIL